MMKRMQKGFFAIAALLSVANVVASSSYAASPYLSVRSQGENAARNMVGCQEFFNMCDMDKFYGALSVSAEYNQSFRSHQLARNLFGNDVTSAAITTTTVNDLNCNSSCNSTSQLTISGSRAATRGANDWLADYFGLPTDFVSTINLKPKIQNFVADINFYMGLSDWAEGLYFSLDMPIAWSKWNLGNTETVTTAGVLAHSPGYFSASGDGDQLNELLANATSFLDGSSAPTLGGTAVVVNKLEASKWASNSSTCRDLSKVRLAHIAANLGYNFVCCDDYHLGVSLRVAAPTGNKPNGDYFFEPIVGNGGHWALGGGLSSHAVLWRGLESDSTFGVYLDANISHLFNACQTRSFDLVGKPNSRYMLAQKMTSTVVGLAGDATAGGTTGTASAYQFANVLAPVANLTKSKVKVSVAVQGDVAVKFAYANGCGFTWDVGYELWARAHERVKPVSTPALDSASWALKGDAHVYGFANADNAAVALGATQSEATIHGGLNGFGAGLDTVAPNPTAIANPNVDNAQYAVTAATAADQIQVAPDSAIQTSTSMPGVLLTADNVDRTTAKAVTSKIFTHFGYSWTNNDDWAPFVGVGASAEFAHGNKANCNATSTTATTVVSSASTTTTCDSSNYKNSNSCAVSQWAVWIKGGIAFN